jgi:hypothetical protein
MMYKLEIKFFNRIIQNALLLHQCPDTTQVHPGICRGSRYLSDPSSLRYVSGYLMPNAELRTIHYEIQAFGDHLLQFSKILVKETDKKQSFTAKKGVRSLLLVPVA